MQKKIAVVTGGNRGLGYATARALAQQGMHVLLTARDRTKAETAASELQDEGLSVEPKRLDIASDFSVDEFVSYVGRVDVLVNNAGGMFGGYSGMSTPAQVVEALNTNTVGAFRLLRLLLPQMNKQGYGRVVNVSSGMAALSEMQGGAAAYRISKTALNAVTRVFHAEARANVKINSVCPGWVKTDMGGKDAPRSIEQGIAGIVWAATLPDDGPSGGFFRDGKPIAW